MQTSGVVLAGLAGCSGDDGDTGGSGGSSGGDSSGSGEQGEPLDLEFGEGAEFSNDSGVRFQVGMSNPRLVETVPVVRDSEIIVDSPESQPYFLFVDVVVANEGESTIEPPRGLYFEANGQEVEREAIRVPGQKYRDIGELAPGESAEATIAFPAPDGTGTGTVSLRFQVLLESPPARWTFDFDEVSRESVDLSKAGLGDTAAVTTGDYGYEFTPTAARETSAYTYGDGNEHAAPDGSKFVLVEARAANVGEEPVNLPNPYGVRLDADGEIARGSQYNDAAERYQGQVEPYAPGESQEGILLFEVAESASSYTLRLAVGNQTFVTWPLSVNEN